MSPLDWMSFPVCSAGGGWGAWHPDLREGWGRGPLTPLFSGQVETCPEKSCQPSTVLLGWKTDCKYYHCKDTGSQYSTCSVCSRHHAGRICQPQPWTLNWAELRHLGVSGIWIIKKKTYIRKRRRVSHQALSLRSQGSGEQLLCTYSGLVDKVHISSNPRAKIYPYFSIFLKTLSQYLILSHIKTEVLLENL